eukprot:GHRR01007860.1.p4 GENE.GHRR01007860.1~~GHRR01007860.1.p4  ORF type:complete len:100 (+),score=24.49 GHRR01007860.1:1143-1442(+)
MGPPDNRSDEQRAAARAKSAAGLVNIDPEERTRRTTVGLGLVALSVVFAAMLLQQSGEDGLLPYDATGALGLLRTVAKSVVIPPFAFGALLAFSGVSGL